MEYIKLDKLKRAFLYLLTIGLTVSCTSPRGSLFDGKTLTNWIIRGGEGGFSVKDGMIVGTSLEGIPSSFLCTNQEYSNFILEYNVMIDEGINSGVQIRSHVWDTDTTTVYKAGDGKTGEKSWTPGQVWGYQVELDPSKRAWSGGFYEEGNRGWLKTLEDNQVARNAFRPGEWNSFRVKAQGNRFQTWINGVAAVDICDDMSKVGFIALQLHPVYEKSQVGKKVYLKNIRIQELKD